MADTFDDVKGIAPGTSVLIRTASGHESGVVKSVDEKAQTVTLSKHGRDVVVSFDAPEPEHDEK